MINRITFFEKQLWYLYSIRYINRRLISISITLTPPGGTVRAVIVVLIQNCNSPLALGEQVVVEPRIVEYVIRVNVNFKIRAFAQTAIPRRCQTLELLIFFFRFKAICSGDRFFGSGRLLFRWRSIWRRETACRRRNIMKNKKWLPPRPRA